MARKSPGPPASFISSPPAKPPAAPSRVPSGLRQNAPPSRTEQPIGNPGPKTRAEAQPPSLQGGQRDGIIDSTGAGVAAAAIAHSKPRSPLGADGPALPPDRQGR